MRWSILAVAIIWIGCLIPGELQGIEYRFEQTAKQTTLSFKAPYSLEVESSLAGPEMNRLIIRLRDYPEHLIQARRLFNTTKLRSLRY